MTYLNYFARVAKMKPYNCPVNNSIFHVSGDATDYIQQSLYGFKYCHRASNSFGGGIHESVIIGLARFMR